jgi:transcriptional regulator with XRE-family HTH domain
MRPGEVVKAARARKGLTQMEVAQRAGVTQQWVCRRETGETSITLADVQVLHGVLELTLEDILRLHGRAA